MKLPDSEYAAIATSGWIAELDKALFDDTLTGPEVDIVRTLLGALKHERKQLDNAVDACREVVHRGNAIHDRVHQHTQRGQTDPRLHDDTHDFLHYCVGASRDGEATGPRVIIGRLGTKAGDR